VSACVRVCYGKQFLGSPIDLSVSIFIQIDNLLTYLMKSEQYSNFSAI